jgi:hypothetical protein
LALRWGSSCSYQARLSPSPRSGTRPSAPATCCKRTSPAAPRRGRTGEPVGLAHAQAVSELHHRHDVHQHLLQRRGRRRQERLRARCREGVSQLERRPRPACQRAAGRRDDLQRAASAPPRNCPSPGDPARLQHTGGGPFTSGDLTVVDAIERLPAAVPAARVRLLRIARPRPGLIQTRSGPSLRVPVCGAPGMALLRVRQRTSPPGRGAPVWMRGELAGRAASGGALPGPPAELALGSATVGRHSIAVRARTTGRRWSRRARRAVDIG